MYHYVQEYNKELPFFNFLHKNDFEKQINYFGEEYGFINRTEFLECLNSEKVANGVVLTFDDGLKCHYKYVFPILKKYQLFGIFYVPTLFLKHKKLIDVHRIHYLLGKVESKYLYEKMKHLITDKYIKKRHFKDFKNVTYTNQRNKKSIKQIKQVLNYYLKDKYRILVIDQLMQQFFPNESSLIEKTYLSSENILELSNNGMIIGSHSVSHPVMSKLDEKTQFEEVENSFLDLQNILGKIQPKTFCYPYGGFHSFNSCTEKILNNQSVSFSFNVESRDIRDKDLRQRKQALPRYDCNDFKHGKIYDWHKLIV